MVRAINQIESFGTPSIVTENVGSTVNADDLRNAFGGVKRVALKCENSKTLSQGKFYALNKKKNFRDFLCRSQF